MANQDLADRVRIRLTGLPFSEQKMFGGICFMLNGNMLVGASPRGLMVRVGKDANDAALARPHTRPMAAEHPDHAGLRHRRQRRACPRRGSAVVARHRHAFVSTLPPKEKKGQAKPAIATARRRGEQRVPAGSPSATVPAM